MRRHARRACAKLTAQTPANSLVKHLEQCKKIARQSVLLGAGVPSLTIVRTLKQALRKHGLVPDKQKWGHGAALASPCRGCLRRNVCFKVTR